MAHFPWLGTEGSGNFYLQCSYLMLTLETLWRRQEGNLQSLFGKEALTQWKGWFYSNAELFPISRISFRAMLPLTNSCCTPFKGMWTQNWSECHSLQHQLQMEFCLYNCGIEATTLPCVHPFHRDMIGLMGKMALVSCSSLHTWTIFLPSTKGESIGSYNLLYSV